MKQYLNVRGTQNNVASLEVNVDTVYIRSNIQRIETEDFSGWLYDEIQYSAREYQELVGNKTDFLSEDVDAVANLVVVSVDDLQMIAEMLVTALDEIENLKGGIK